MRRIIGLLALLAILVAVVMIIVRFANPDAFSDSDTALRLVYAAGLITLIGGGIVGAFASRPSASIRDFAIWAALFLVVMTGYALRHDFALIGSRMVGELAPSHAQEDENGVLTLYRSDDTHFYLDAQISGQRVRFLVDTGATIVALTQADARRIGLAPERLTFNRAINTAAGQSLAAAITLPELHIGTTVLRDVEVLVMRDGGRSLLGMNALNAFDRIEVSGRTLTLYPRGR